MFKARIGTKLTDNERKLIKENTSLADYGKLEMAYKEDPDFSIKAGTIDAVVRQQRNVNKRNYKALNNLWSIALQNAISTKTIKEQQIKELNGVGS